MIQRVIQFIENVSTLSSVGTFFAAIAMFCLGVDSRAMWAAFFASLGVLCLTIVRPTMQYATAALLRRANKGVE